MVPALTLNQKTRECEIENADAIYDTGPILFYFFFKKKIFDFYGSSGLGSAPLVSDSWLVSLHQPYFADEQSYKTSASPSLTRYCLTRIASVFHISKLYLYLLH